MSYTLIQVLTDVRDFLQTYPSETVWISMSRVSAGDRTNITANDEQKFFLLLAANMAPFWGMFKRGMMENSLGQGYRGKCILVTDASVDQNKWNQYVPRKDLVISEIATTTAIHRAECVGQDIYERKRCPMPGNRRTQTFEAHQRSSKKKRDWL
jgi:hypothetical protein